MKKLSGFTFNKIVIVQSLEPDEVKSGDILSEFIAGLPGYADLLPPIEIINCNHAGQFLEILRDLTRAAATGEIPLLHVECHGDRKFGLEFENSSTLSWEDLSEALTPLNSATRFNLLTVFSACYGAHFLEQMGAIAPSPCWCLVAPTESVGVDEILGGFRCFYSALINECDIGSAVRSISSCRLSHGRWLSEPAELWFETLITGYIKSHCTQAAARGRAREMYRQLKSQGKHCSVGALIRKLRKRNREDLDSSYFNRYFMVSEIPENFERFGSARDRVTKSLKILRHTGKYVI